MFPYKAILLQGLLYGLVAGAGVYVQVLPRAEGAGIGSKDPVQKVKCHAAHYGQCDEQPFACSIFSFSAPWYKNKNPRHINARVIDIF